MHEVALHLQTAAVSRRKNPAEFDQFGRSAFNRYYYSVFLEVRVLIREFKPDWAGAHSQLPSELTGSITREIRAKKKSALAKKQSDAIPVFDRGLQGLDALSTLLNKANTVRIQADYVPEVKISDLGSKRFSLGAVPVTDAHNWLAEAKRNIELVRRAWRLARGGS